MLNKPFLSIEVKDNKVVLGEYKKTYKGLRLIQKYNWNLRENKEWEELEMFLYAKKAIYKKVYLIFSTSNIISREIIVPQTGPRELKMILEMHMGEYFPISIKEYYWQYRIAEKIHENNEKKYRILMIAIPQSMIMKYIELAVKHGLLVEKIDYSGMCISCSVWKTIDKDVQPVGIIDLQENQMTCFIAKKGKLLFSRHYSYESISPPLCSSDCIQFLDFYNSRNPDKKIEKIYLLGKAEDVKIYKETIENKINKKIFNLKNEGVDFWVGIFHTRTNFLPNDYKERMKRIRRNKIVYSFLIGMWGISAILWFQLEKENEFLKIQWQNLHLEVGNFQAIESKEKELKDVSNKVKIQEDLLNEVINNQERWITFFSQIDAHTSDRTFLTNIQYKDDQLSITGKSSRYREISDTMNFLTKMEFINEVEIQQIRLSTENKEKQDVYRFVLQCILEE